jgi:predicted amidohydrolase YtcJ
LVIHGNGDAAIDSILDAYEAADKAGIDIKALRCRNEHASILHDEQIARMQRLKICPSFLLNHVYYWGKFMRDKVFGPDKVLLLDRCAAVEKAGLTWSMHSGAPVSPMDMLQLIKTAAARDLWKEPGTVLAPEERVSVPEAIRAATWNAARSTSICCSSMGCMSSVPTARCAPAGWRPRPEPSWWGLPRPWHGASVASWSAGKP